MGKRSLIVQNLVDRNEADLISEWERAERELMNQGHIVIGEYDGIIFPNDSNRATITAYMLHKYEDVDLVAFAGNWQAEIFCRFCYVIARDLGYETMTVAQSSAPEKVYDVETGEIINAGNEY